MKIIFEENDRKITVENSDETIMDHLQTIVGMLYAWGFGEETIIDGFREILREFTMYENVVEREEREEEK